MWSRAGQELFFRTLDNKIMVASYTANGKSFHAEKPRLWSQTRLANVGQWRNYDLTSEDKRILALLPAEPTEQRMQHGQVIFLRNFFDALRQRAAKPN